MKLVKLESDNPHFRIIDFKPGLNIVVGYQLTEDDKKTYNGVGKSLSLTLIHLILGANFSKTQKKLKDFLTTYGAFHLTVEFPDKVMKFTKDFSQTCYYINGEEKNITEYRNELNDIFGISGKGFTFRQALNCFARRFGGNTYTDALTQQSVNITDYSQRFVNLKLLGVNTSLVEKKCEIKEQITKIDSASDAIEKYEPDDDSNLSDIIDSIDDLKNEIKNFRIAENYDSLKKEAEDQTESLNIIRNSIYNLERRKRRNIENLNLIRDIKIDPKEVINVYKEANLHFDDKIVNHLSAAQEFHSTLLSNRKYRIEVEIENLEKEKNKLIEERSEISQKRDALLKDLDSSGALEEYNSLNTRLRALESERDNLEKYDKMKMEFEKKKTRLKATSATIQSESIEYIDQNLKDFSEKEKIFRNIVKRFYDTTRGTLKLVSTKDAKYLYDIEVHVPREGSQGIGEVKIFCYDVFLFLQNKELLGFLAHDGCIFSEMDHRQKAMIFKIVLELIEDYDLQYFININQNSIKEILSDENKVLTDDEKRKIKDSVRLQLNDLKPENWLFGEAFG